MSTLFLFLLLKGLFVANADDGIGIDPFGGARAAARCGDDGSGLDPHGKPCTQRQLSGDEGSGFDPHG
jgi:hypothetical protein